MKLAVHSPLAHIAARADKKIERDFMVPLLWICCHLRIAPRLPPVIIGAEA